jgi:predicted transcriptional regulator
MARPALNRPTDAELEILRALWDAGPMTVRDVYERLAGGRGRRRPVGYTGVLKLMQIMTDKGLLARDERRRTHVYRAAAPREQTQRHLVKDLLDRAFGGSARALVLQALSARKATAAELAEIRDLVEEFRRAERPDTK